MCVDACVPAFVMYVAMDGWMDWIKMLVFCAFNPAAEILQRFHPSVSLLRLCCTMLRKQARIHGRQCSMQCSASRDDRPS